jgi:chemotaxis protein methyltransferase CheR
MDDKSFNLIIEKIYAQAGIRLGHSKKALVSARISKRIRALQLNDFKEYVKYLDSHTDELIEFLNALTTNYTFFFREESHFAIFKEELHKKARTATPLKIWCAAASTGEEPYSIAMILKEDFDKKPGSVKFLATDLDTKVLEKCKEGRYKKAAIAKLPIQYRKHFAKDHHSDDYIADNTLKDLIHFNRLNLAQIPYPMSGPFDFIFCRNVMIYFDAAVRQKLVNEVARLLAPGGLFFIGHSESLTGLNHPFHTVKPSVYRWKP